MWFGDPGSNNGCFSIWCHEGGNIRTFRQIIDFSASNFAVAEASNYVINTWQQVGLAAASATSLYAIRNGVRGTEITTSSTGLTFSVMDEITLGRYDRTSVFGSLNGFVAHAALWNAALTEQEWAMLGSGISPLRVRPQNLHAYYPTLGRDTNDIDIIRAKTFTATGTTSSPNEPPLIWPQAAQST